MSHVYVGMDVYLHVTRFMSMRDGWLVAVESERISAKFKLL